MSAIDQADERDGHTCHCPWGAPGVACSCVMCCDGQAPAGDLRGDAERTAIVEEDAT